MKRRKYYEKPSEARTREKAEAVRRARKNVRKQMIREGLIAAPKRPQQAQSRRPQARPQPLAEI
jgi:small subunit ribosomal protein S21